MLGKFYIILSKFKPPLHGRKIPGIIKKINKALDKAIRPHKTNKKRRELKMIMHIVTKN